MKKILFLFIILISYQSNAQVLEIIDAIGGTLLPKVVDGIKDIKNSGNNSKVKVDRDKFENSMNDLNEYVAGITSSLANDAKSLDAIGKITSNASQLYDDLGALETLSTDGLVGIIITSNNEPAQRQYAFAFDSDFAQLNEDIDGVKTSVLGLTIDQSLKDNLSKLIDDVKTEYTDLETHIAQSGIKRPTAETSIDQLVNYLNAIKNASPNISQIKQSVQFMLSTLNSRLSSYVNEATKAKESVNKKFKEISE